MKECTTTPALCMKEMWKVFTYCDGALIRRSTGKPTGYKMKTGYLQVGIGNRLQYAHRIIFLMFYGYLPKEVDHRNGDRSDNRISNLRDTGRAENQWNRRMQKRNKIGMKGVWWSTREQKWHSTILKNGKKFHLGYFDTPDEGAEAYRLASMRLHGEYSIWNRSS